MQAKQTRTGKGRVYLILHQDGRQSALSLTPLGLRLAFAGMILLVAGFLTQSFLLLGGADLRTPSAQSGPRAEHYHKRISQLQSELERVTSRQLLDSDLLERRIVQIAARQASLETQGQFLDTLAAQAGPAGGTTQLRRHQPASVPLPPVRPRPAEATAAPPPAATAPKDDAAPLRLRRLEGSIQSLEDKQAAALDALGSNLREQTARMDAALQATGLRAGPPSTIAATGGPFIALEGRVSEAFAQRLLVWEPALARHAQLAAAVQTVPLRAPLPGPYEITSHFGARMDPFLRRAAFHGGIDLRDEQGSDVHATGNGRVTFAGWNGAYGFMVEIDHANSMTTRYAHLAQVHVNEGQLVVAGARIGRMGSTGRSTGAHLHYEIRVEDRAIDPLRFLRAGESLNASAHYAITDQ